MKQEDSDMIMIQPIEPKPLQILENASARIRENVFAFHPMASAMMAQMGSLMQKLAGKSDLATKHQGYLVLEGIPWPFFNMAVLPAREYEDVPDEAIQFDKTSLTWSREFLEADPLAHIFGEGWNRSHKWSDTRPGHATQTCILFPPFRLSYSHKSPNQMQVAFRTGAVFNDIGPRSQQTHGG